jgi:hypothetical protein
MTKQENEVVNLRNQNQWLRNCLIRIKRCIQTDDTTYALAIILQTLEATNEASK